MGPFLQSVFIQTVKCQIILNKGAGIYLCDSKWNWDNIAPSQPSSAPLIPCCSNLKIISANINFRTFCLLILAAQYLIHRHRTLEQESKTQSKNFYRIHKNTFFWTSLKTSFHVSSNLSVADATPTSSSPCWWKCWRLYSPHTCPPPPPTGCTWLHVI